jgi:ParB family chromosome partitioning protein
MARELLDLDPAGLLVDRNLRTEAEIGKGFIASVRDHGVLVPIVGVRTPDGEIRVRSGHRRVLAAVKAGLASVPVLVAGDEDDDDLARVLHQWTENEQRANLTTADKVAAIEQLAAFGLKAAAIVKRTGAPKDYIDQALAVGRSELAQQATVRYDFLTLPQAAAVAEFEEDAEAVKRLVLAAKTGDFEHVAQRLRHDRDKAVAVDAAREKFTAAGYELLGNYSETGMSRQVTRLQSPGPDAAPGDGMKPEEHEDCPHRAVWIEAGSWYPEGYRAYHFCLDWRAAGHAPRYAEDPAPPKPAESEEERAAREAEAEAERARREELAAAWTAAHEVRGAYVRQLLTRAKPNRALQQPVLAALVTEMTDPEAYFEFDTEDVAGLAGRMPEIPDEAAREVAASTALRLLHPEVAILAIVCTLGEDQLKTGVRKGNARIRRYLQLLRTAGYTLAPCEEALLVVATCRVCGCTDERACDGGCSWIAADLCSSCDGRGDDDAGLHG